VKSLKKWVNNLKADGKLNSVVEEGVSLSSMYKKREAMTPAEEAEI
jgi:hypothetical protein